MAATRVQVTAREGPGEGTSSYAFGVPQTVEAGLIRFSLANRGDEPHHAQVFKLAPGATFEQLRGALATGDPAAALAFGGFVGGTALVAPGGTSTAEAELALDAGSYVLLCFVEGPDGLPHLAHGMVQPFEDRGEADGRPPPSDATVELSDYRIAPPATVSGRAQLVLRNTSTAEPHEMILGRLEGSARVGSVLDALAAGQPMPATPVGGMQAIPPGASALLQLDLQPGRYVVICQIPSPDGTPHYVKGMVGELTVT
jgi:hypothetical protein